MIPLSAVPTAKPEDSLDAAFSETESSHDTVFVFDEQGIFLGIVSPSYCLFRNRYSYQTKVQTCLVTPPSITSSTPLPRIAEFMISTGMYQLPVFGEDGSITGVVTARDLLQRALKERAAAGAIAKVRPDKVLVASKDASLKDVYQEFRKKGVSRIVLVADSGTMQGIVARRDIQWLLTKPANRQRIKTGGAGQTRNYVFGVEKEKRLTGRVAEFARRNVLSAPRTTDPSTLLERMLQAKRNSIVLTDARERPVGIVSIRTFLAQLSKLKQEEEEVPVSLVNNAKLSDGDMEHVRTLVERAVRKLARRSSLSRVEFVIDEARNTAGRPVMFEAKYEAFFYSGERLFASSKKRDLMQAVREALERVEKQQRRSK